MIKSLKQAHALILNDYQVATLGFFLGGRGGGAREE